MEHPSDTHPRRALHSCRPLPLAHTLVWGPAREFSRAYRRCTGRERPAARCTGVQSAKSIAPPLLLRQHNFPFPLEKGRRRRERSETEAASSMALDGLGHDLLFCRLSSTPIVPVVLALAPRAVLAPRCTRIRGRGGEQTRDSETDRRVRGVCARPIRGHDDCDRLCYAYGPQESAVPRDAFPGRMDTARCIPCARAVQELVGALCRHAHA